MNSLYAPQITFFFLSKLTLLRTLQRTPPRCFLTRQLQIKCLHWLLPHYLHNQ